MKAIAAMSENRVIGNSGVIPWHITEDIRFFKGLTVDNVVLMGRPTYESIGKPLPHRINIVASRGLIIPKVLNIGDPKFFDFSVFSCDVFLIGGAEMYNYLLPECTDLYLTTVHKKVEGDRWFPAFEDDWFLYDTIRDEAEFTINHYKHKIKYE